MRKKQFLRKMDSPVVGLNSIKKNKNNELYYLLSFILFLWLLSISLLQITLIYSEQQRFHEQTALISKLIEQIEQLEREVAANSEQLSPKAADSNGLFPYLVAGGVCLGGAVCYFLLFGSIFPGTAAGLDSGVQVLTYKDTGLNMDWFVHIKESSIVKICLLSPKWREQMDATDFMIDCYNAFAEATGWK
jgi:hypothetical protein